MQKKPKSSQPQSSSPERFVLDVTPLDKLPTHTPDFFSYFGNANIGDLVDITVRNYKKQGLVIGAQPTSAAKAYLKKLNFPLKPISAVLHSRPLLSDKQLAFAQWLKTYTNISLPHALDLLTSFRKKIIGTDIGIKPQSHKKTKGKFKTFWSKDIPEKFLQHLPALLIAPKEEYLPYLQKKFPHAFMVDFSLPKKQYENLFEKIYSGEKILFLGSKHALFLPWQYLDGICLFDEGSQLYKDYFVRPFFDFRPLAKTLAHIHNIPLYKTGVFPSFSTISHISQKTMQKLFLKPLQFEAIEQPLEDLLDIKEYPKTTIFSLYGGLGSSIVCELCFSSLPCPQCVLTHPEEHILLLANESGAHCRSCFYHGSIPKLCPTCQGEHFFIRAPGVAWMYTFLKNKGYPTTIYKNRASLKELEGAKRFILLGGSDMFIPDLPESDVLFFAHFNRLFYSQDPFLKEEFLRILYFFKNKTKKIILHLEPKKRTPFEFDERISFEEDIMQSISNGSYLTHLFEERLQLHLPPYSRMIRLVGRLSSLPTLQKRMFEVREILEDRANTLRKKELRIELHGPFLQSVARKKSRYQVEIMLQVDPKTNVRQLLLQLPHIEEIEIDCQSL